MNKRILKTGVIVFVFLGLILSLGCSKAKSKFKVPKMKFISRENVHGVFASDDDNIWIVGNYGSIYHSTDGGQKWKKQKSEVTSTILCDGIALDSKTAWIAGTHGVILHTTDGGENWVKQNTGTKHHIFSVSFVDKQYGWATGSFSTLIHTTDGGKTWQKQIEEKDMIYSNIFFVDRQYGWTVGEYGTVLSTVDGGLTWDSKVPECVQVIEREDEYSSMVPTFFGVYFTDRLNGLVCGLYSAIIHTTDGGQTWARAQNDGVHPLYTVYAKGDKAWAVGEKGAYLKSFDGGKTFKLQEDAIKSRLWFRDVFFTSPEKGWVVGASGIVARSVDEGHTWSIESGLSYEFAGFEMPEELERRVEE